MFNSPYWFIQYKEPVGDVEFYEDRVLDLLQRSITHELFGLSYWDLMNMELPTFNKVRKRILDICDEQAKLKQKLDEEQANLERTINNK